MIKATQALKLHIEAQENFTEFCKRAGLSKGAVYAVLTDKTPSTDTVQKLLNVTGFDYEKAFEVKG